MNYKCTNDPKISALMKKAKRAAQRNITKWMFDVSENADIKSPFYINKKKRNQISRVRHAYAVVRVQFKDNDFIYFVFEAE